MKKLLIIALLSSSFAQAESRIVVCEAQEKLSAINQFSLEGVFQVDGEKTTAAVTASTRNAGPDSQFQQLGKLDFSGSAKVIAAGQLMTHATQILRLKNDNGSEQMSLLLGGPEGSSSLMVNGKVYKSTCNSN